MSDKELKVKAEQYKAEINHCSLFNKRVSSFSRGLDHKFGLILEE